MEGITSPFQRLFENPKYADLTLMSSWRIYPAHRAIVCMRSPVIDKACEFQASKRANSLDSAEGTTDDTFDFLDDDPQVVDCLVQYLYNTEYKERPKDSNDFHEGVDKDRECSESSTVPVGVDGAELVLHVKVYALAEKYGIAPLKKLALDKFKDAVSRPWSTPGFLRAAQEAYTSTIPEDRGMRDTVVKVFDEYRQVFRRHLLGNEDARKLFSDTKDLAADIYMYEAREVEKKRRWK